MKLRKNIPKNSYFILFSLSFYSLRIFNPLKCRSINLRDDLVGLYLYYIICISTLMCMYK